MILAEAGYPDARVTAEVTEGRDDFSVPLGDGPGQVPEEVWWRAGQVLATQRGYWYWCWTCCQAGYDGSDCHADRPLLQDCGRPRG